MTSLPVSSLKGRPASDLRLGSQHRLVNRINDFNRILQSVARPLPHGSLSGRPAGSEILALDPASAREQRFAPGPSPELTHRGVPSEATGSATDEQRAAPLDPLELVLSAPVLRGEPAAVVRGGAFDACVQDIVRQIAWGGDRRRGAARIELGAGRFAGASVLVEAEGNQVSLELRAPAGVDAALLGERLRERLEARGLVVRELSVR